MVIPPAFDHAETNPAYAPRARNAAMEEAQRLATAINQTKVTDPDAGEKIYDKLVDQLIYQTTVLAKQTDQLAEPAGWTAAQRIVWRSSRLPSDQRFSITLDRSISPNAKAFAVVNAGRWLVNCPFPGCRSAQYASFEDHRFFCCECFNLAVGKKWVEVVWPEDHSAVEIALSNRPTECQHWVPGETAEDIAKQDMEHIKRAS